MKQTYITKVILDDEGIRMKGMGYIYQDYLGWDEIKEISYEFNKVSTYILVPKTGKSMYLGLKNINQLLSDVEEHTSDVYLHPKVEKRINKVRNK